jgi:hypothetical protein
MQKMFKRLVIKLLLTSALLINSQLKGQDDNGSQIRIQTIAGNNISTFRFRDSEQSKDKELSWKYSSMAGIGIERVGKKSTVNVGLATRSAGAYSDFDNIFIEWSTRYIDITVSYAFKIIHFKNNSLHIGTGISYSLLSNAIQQIGNERFNMIKEQSISSTDFLLNNSLILKHNITESIDLSLGYRFGLGLKNIEKTETLVNGENQNTRNIYHAILLGVSFKI